MLEYYTDITAISIELVITSGGIAVTGRNPSAQIWSPDLSLYFDFVSRTFTGVPGNTSILLTSAVDGIYRANWDVSGLFSSNSGTHLSFEYVDGTSVATDQVRIVTKPNGGGGGFGPVIVKGQWTAKQKKQILDDVEEIKKVLKELRRDTLILLRKILSKQVVTKEDISLLSKMKERDKLMWQELLKILKLREDSTTQDVLRKLSEYNEKEEQAKKELLKLLEEKLSNTPTLDKIKEEEEDE